MPRIFRCTFCGKTPPTIQGLRSHLSQRKPCRDAMRRRLAAKDQSRSATPEQQSEMDDQHTELDSDAMIIDHELDVEEENPGQAAANGEPNCQPENRRPTVEDVDDEDDNTDRWIEDYPRPAGIPIRPAQTYFEELREDQKEHGKNPWAPFTDQEEWELAQWLMLNVGQNATDKFLKLPIVSILYAASKHKPKA